MILFPICCSLPLQVSRKKLPHTLSFSRFASRTYAQPCLPFLPHPVPCAELSLCIFFTRARAIATLPVQAREEGPRAPRRHGSERGVRYGAHNLIAIALLVLECLQLNALVFVPAIKWTDFGKGARLEAAARLSCLSLFSPPFMGSLNLALPYFHMFFTLVVC